MLDVARFATRCGVTGAPRLLPQGGSAVRVRVQRAGAADAVVLPLSGGRVVRVAAVRIPERVVHVGAYFASRSVFVVLLCGLQLLPPALLATLLYARASGATSRRCARSTGDGHAHPPSPPASPHAADASRWSAVVERLDLLYLVYRPGYSGYAGVDVPAPAAAGVAVRVDGAGDCVRVVVLRQQTRGSGARAVLAVPQGERRLD